MKSKHLLLMLLLALMAPWAANAQETLTVCDGEETNQYVPFYGWYGDEVQTNQMIYPADQLTAMAGSSITKMVFYWDSQSGSYTLCNWVVSLGTTTASTLSGIDNTTALTQVYSGAMSFDETEQTMTIVFDDAFIYDGNNLLIQFNNPITSSYEYHSYYFKGVEATGASFCYGSQRDFLPRVTFTYEVLTDPYIALNPASTTVMTGFTQTLTASYGNVTGTPTINYTSNNPSVATVSGSGTTATVTGVSVGTATITATMNYGGTDYTATCNVTVEEPHPCTPSFSNTYTGYSLYISGFSTTEGETNINTSSNGLSTGGYGNYYGTYSASAEAGQTINFTVTPAGTVNFMIYAIWVDWNQDYDFDDDGEQVALQSTGIQTEWTGTISIPATAPLGDHYMRIMGASSYYYTTLVPCMDETYGEAEDYKLVVLQAADCPKPSNVQLTASGATVTATWEGDANSYNIDIDGIVTPNATTGNTYSFTGELSTTYTVKVQANCDGGKTSDWSNEKSITTEACMPEDQCALTITLTDAYGDGGGQIQVVDANTDEVLGTYTNSSSSTTYTLNVCDGREINFVFASTDSYAYENGYVITDVNGEVIAEHEGCSSSGACTAPTNGVVANYTMNCSSCLKPTNLEATNITTNSAVISWEGDHEKYDLRYKPDQTYHFEEGLGAWTSIDADGDGFGWRWSYGESGITGNNGGYCLFSQSYDNNGSQVLYPDNYLVSPKVQLGGSISFYACAQDASYAAEHFGVAVSTTGNTNAADFTTIQEWTMTSDGTGTPGAKTQGTWGLFTVDLSAYSGEGYVAIRHFNSSDMYFLDVDDITILEPGQVVDWSVINNITTKTRTLNDLEETMPYEVQVRGYCTGETEPTNWTNSIAFTTLSGNVFITAGNWNVASNWQGGEVPAAGSNVIIAANATVPAGYTADAGNVTFENSATLTVADGGQFKTTYAGINVTMQKHINGTDFGTLESPTSTGYYLIANPVITVQDPTTLGMTANDYDLYYFDASEETEEWQNFKDNSFTMGNTNGYLYANSNNLDIEFTGEANVTSITKKVTLTYHDGYAFGGFSLVGNPYTCNAYLADGRAFYVMNADGDEIITATSNVIAPMTGLFVNIDADDNINFTTTAPAALDLQVLHINLASLNSQVDRAVVNFGKGNGLEKFQLNPSHTKLYIPQDNKDFAVVYSEDNSGEMPLNFKAEKNGSYTLSFGNENVEFGYLHLIDNMTGNDVNLLETPSYSFEAKTTDYASRFRLVFATGNNGTDDTFAFNNGSEWIVANEGEATLQVIDILGRQLSSEKGHSEFRIPNSAFSTPGVYMLRLINGDNVRTQKVIVK